MTKADKQVVILQCIDMTEFEMKSLMHGLANLGRSCGYEFAITNVPIYSIPKDELLKHLTSKEECN